MERNTEHNKEKLKKTLCIIELVSSMISLISIIICIVCWYNFGRDNIGTQITLCIAIIGIVESYYASGYLKGLLYQDKNEGNN